MVMVYVRKLWAGFIWLRLGRNDNSHEECNEPLESIHGGEFIE
jgi:hypothetical protein